MTPRTSVIMPVYGTAATVLRAMRSVLEQTDPDLELIVIDDCSPDDAAAVIRAHLAEHPDDRVRYLSNERNLTLPGTRNRGMDLARGAWIAFLDSDDAYEPRFLERMHAAAEEDVDVVVCPHTMVYPDGTQRVRRRGCPGTFTGEQMLCQLLEDRTTPYAWDKIYRASALQGVRFPIINRVEDAGFNIAAYPQVRKVRVIDEPLHRYSVNASSITWGSVPPLAQSWAFIEHMKAATGWERGTAAEQDALATAWVLIFLNSSQAALRLLSGAELREHLRQVRRALRLPLLARTLRTRPVYGLAGLLLKASPALYRLLYGAYIRRAYGL